MKRSSESSVIQRKVPKIRKESDYTFLPCVVSESLVYSNTDYVKKVQEKLMIIVQHPDKAEGTLKELKKDVNLFQYFCSCRILYKNYLHHVILFILLYCEISLSGIEEVLEENKNALNDPVVLVGKSGTKHLIAVAIDEDVDLEIVEHLLKRASSIEIPKQVDMDKQCILTEAIKSGDASYVELFLQECQSRHVNEKMEKKLLLSFAIEYGDCYHIFKDLTEPDFNTFLKTSEGEAELRDWLCVACYKSKRHLFRIMRRIYPNIPYHAQIHHEKTLTTLQQFPLIDLLRDGIGDIDTARHVEKMLRFNIYLFHQCDLIANVKGYAIVFAIQIGHNYDVIDTLFKFERIGLDLNHCIPAILDYKKERNPSPYILTRARDVDNQTKILKRVAQWGKHRKVCEKIEDALEDDLSILFCPEEGYTLKMLKCLQSLDDDFMVMYDEDEDGYLINQACKVHPFPKDVVEYLVEQYSRHKWTDSGHPTRELISVDEEVDIIAVRSNIFRLSDFHGNNALFTFLESMDSTKYEKEELIEIVGYFLKMFPGVAVHETNNNGLNVFDIFPLANKSECDEERYETLSDMFNTAEDMILHVKLLYDPDYEDEVGFTLEDYVCKSMIRFKELGWYHGIYICYDVYYTELLEEGCSLLPVKFDDRYIPKFLSHLSSYFKMDSTYGWLKSHVSKWCR